MTLLVKVTERLTIGGILWRLLRLCAEETAIHHRCRNAPGIFNEICNCHVRSNENLAPQYSHIKGKSLRRYICHVDICKHLILNTDRSRLAETQ